MTLIAGIDEAGFGPKLGPLVMSGTVFRVPEDRADACLWRLLKNTCTKKPTRKGRRLAVADSKVLYNGDGALGPLERAALVMLGVWGTRPGTWHSLLQSVAKEQVIEAARELPWYCDDFDLPASDETGDVGTRVNAIRGNCQEQGIDFLGAFCEPLAESRYNARLAESNKAAVNMSLALSVIRRILESDRNCGFPPSKGEGTLQSGGDHGLPQSNGDGRLQSDMDRCLLQSSGDTDVRIYVDRLGGRTRYAEGLQAAFPDWNVEVLHEAFAKSAYRMTGGGRTVTIQFAVGGEDHHFATALASVFSKYVRELYMRAFNAYWSKQVAGLRPTAGYFGDARRWLKDAGPAIRQMAVQQSCLVRTR